MKLFENVFKFDEDETPILVLDLKVSLWRILYRVKKDEEFWTFDDLKLFWQNKINNPIESHLNQKFKIIVVNDIKYKGGNYWRNNYLKKLEENYPEYKGNRDKVRPELFYKLEQAAIEYIKENNFTYLAKRGYEADDYAGAICSKIIELGGIRPHVILYTVDSDWGQLVNDRLKILFYYCSTPAWKHRLRNEDIIREWFKEKQNIDLQSVRDIVDVKVEFGDKSDNLIANSPRGVIDLLNPYKTLPRKDLKEIERILKTDSKTSNPRKGIEARLKLDKKLYNYVNEKYS